MRQLVIVYSIPLNWSLKNSSNHPDLPFPSNYIINAPKTATNSSLLISSDRSFSMPQSHAEKATLIAVNDWHSKALVSMINYACKQTLVLHDNNLLALLHSTLLMIELFLFSRAFFAIICHCECFNRCLSWQGTIECGVLFFAFTHAFLKISLRNIYCSFAHCDQLQLLNELNFPTSRFF